MTTYRIPSFEYELLEMLDTNRLNMGINPVVLGGTSGSAGGEGVPPGGFIGQLVQSFVTYDTTEASDSSGSASLVDNLNHIRKRITNLEAGSGGALTPGSIPFASSSGSLTQDNAELFWNDTNKTLSIGANPTAMGSSSAKLIIQRDVGAAIQSSLIYDVLYGDSPFASPGFIQGRSRGSYASPTALMSGDTIGYVSFFGRRSPTQWSGSASLIAKALEDFSSGSAGIGLDVYVVPAGGLSASRAFSVNSVLSSGSMVWTDSSNVLTSKSLENIVDGSTITVSAGVLTASGGGVSRKRVFWNGA